MITETLKAEISKYVQSGFLYCKQYRELLDMAINDQTDINEFDKYLHEEMEKNNCRKELSYKDLLRLGDTKDTRDKCLWDMLHRAAVVETVDEYYHFDPETECQKALRKYPNDAAIVGVVEQIRTSMFAKGNAKKNFYIKLGIIIVIFLAIIFIGNGKKNKSANASLPAQTENTVQTNSVQTIQARSAMSNPYASKLPGEYPVVSERKISTTEIAGCSKDDLKIMRNEIFARHGYIFKTNEMKSYFNKQKWYKGKYNNVDNMLTDVEIHNIKVIQEVEKR